MSKSIPQPTPEPKPTKTVSHGVMAGRLYSRIMQLRADRDAEIAQSPDEIRARFAKKEAAAMAAADPFVRELAERMLSEEKIDG
jgi:hypothetical protein